MRYKAYSRTKTYRVQDDDNGSWRLTLSEISECLPVDRATLRALARLRVGKSRSSGSGASPWYSFTRIA